MNYKKTNAHEGVKKLHLTGNLISEWNEICRVGRIFPNLETLILADCPITTLDPTDPDNKCPKETCDENIPHSHFRYRLRAFNSFSTDESNIAFILLLEI